MSDVRGDLRPVPGCPGWQFGPIVRGNDPDGQWVEMRLSYAPEDPFNHVTLVVRLEGDPPMDKIVEGAQAKIAEWAAEPGTCPGAAK